MTPKELKYLITGLMENHIDDRCCSEQERVDSRAKLAEALATIDQIAETDRKQMREVLRKLVEAENMKTRLKAAHSMGLPTNWDRWMRLDQEAWATARLLAMGPTPLR